MQCVSLVVHRRLRVKALKELLWKTPLGLTTKIKEPPDFFANVPMSMPMPMCRFPVVLQTRKTIQSHYAPFPKYRKLLFFNHPTPQYHKTFWNFFSYEHHHHQNHHHHHQKHHHHHHHRSSSIVGFAVRGLPRASVTNRTSQSVTL